MACRGVGCETVFELSDVPPVAAAPEGLSFSAAGSKRARFASRFKEAACSVTSVTELEPLLVQVESVTKTDRLPETKTLGLELAFAYVLLVVVGSAMSTSGGGERVTLSTGPGGTSVTSIGRTQIGLSTLLATTTTTTRTRTRRERELVGGSEEGEKGL